MLILEGPDGAGKTSLGLRLQRDLRLPFAPRVVGSDTRAKVDLARWTEENVQKGFQRTIFDRHRLISEPIYGPILRPRQDTKFLDLGWMQEMTWLFYALKPVVIYCMPPFEVVMHNVNNPDTDNQKVANPETMEAIYASYVSRATMDFSRGTGRLFNYKTTRYDDILQWTKFQMEKNDDRAGSSIIPHQQHRRAS